LKYTLLLPYGKNLFIGGAKRGKTRGRREGKAILIYSRRGYC